MRVRLVKKAILEVPNVPAVPLVKRVRASMVLAKPVRWVNLVRPTTILLLLADRAQVAIIKQFRAKRLVCRAFLARMRMRLDQPNVKIAAKDNIKAYRATTRVWIAQQVDT